ncbi:hypothetical protein T265_08223 [Opisthorchis viverrini]|uniref:F5/8 type C domain-containing protein n=1 Tax=Opisthorchis viverrini TaxID=6198 RepID=A0A075A914_OPIVI|nr:hypothetical protein T265_08223 [Opisthorchis viverrini]KER24014.1 hypothetical protein T265_08223 [Opisthorchis viverrini]
MAHIRLYPTAFGYVLFTHKLCYIVSVRSDLSLPVIPQQPQAKCVDSGCDKKESCDSSSNHRPEFRRTSYVFELKSPSPENVKSLVGTVEAENLDDPTGRCGVVNYYASVEGSSIPIEIGRETGEIIITDWSTFNLWPKTYEFNVTAQYPGQTTHDASWTTVELIVHQESGDGEESLRRSKRSADNPPTELTFSMEKLTDLESMDLCRGCFWKVKLVLGLPTGNHQPTVELFAFSDESAPQGYVRKVRLVRQGSKIRSPISVSTSTINNILEMGVTHMAVDLGSLQVEEGASSAEDFQVILEFEMGLSDHSSLPDASTITGGAGALLGETLWIGAVNARTAPPLDYKIEIANCPASVHPGDVIALTIDTVLPFASGNYSFEVNSITPSVSIQHVELQPGAGFGSSLQATQKRIIDVQDSLVLGKTIQTIITGAENSYASDTRNSDANRGIKIMAYVQVSPFAATRMSVSIYSYLPNGLSVIRTCDSVITTTKPADFTETIAQMTAPTVENAAATEKLVNITFPLSVPASSKQSYSITLEVTDVPGAELGHATMTIVDSKIASLRSGTPLLTSFSRSGDDNLVLKAQTFLGTVHNSDGSSAASLSVSSLIKLRTEDVLKPDTSILLRATLAWEGGSQDPLSVSVTSAAKSTPTASLGGEKVPQISLEKSQPSGEDPTADYGTVLRMKVKFASDVVYMPVTFRMEFSPNLVKLLDSRFESLDLCFGSVVPVGIGFSPNGENIYDLMLPSIYAPCVVMPQDGWVVFRFVVSSPSRFTAKASVVINQLTYEKQLEVLVTPFSSPLELSDQDVPLVNVTYANMVNYEEDKLIYPGVNLLLLTLTIKPDTKQKYTLQVSSADTAKAQACYPRVLSFDSEVGFEIKEPTPTETGADVEIGYVFYQDTKIDASLGTMVGVHTLAYALPLRTIQNLRVELTATLTYGTRTIAKTITSALTSVPGPTLSSTADAGSLELFDLDPRSKYSPVFLAAPGEVVKFYYEIRLQETKCSSYKVTVTHSNDATWPVDLSGIYLHSHGASIWCLDTVPTFTSVKSPGDPVVTNQMDMEVGTVCSQGTTDSWVRFLIYARPWFSPPNKETISGTVQRAIKVVLTEDGSENEGAGRDLQFTVDPNKVMAERPSKSSVTAALEFSPPSAEGHPGKTTAITAKIRVPPAAKFPESQLTFHCEATGRPSQAACTFSEVTISAGRDFASLESETLNVTITSDAESGQLNKAVVSLGNLVQTGISALLGLKVSDSDVLSAVVKVKLADSENANNDANIPIRVTVKLGSQTTTETENIRVIRTGSETMELKLVSELLNFDGSSQFQPDQSLQIRVNRSMRDSSQLECQEQFLQVHNGKIFTEVTIADQSTGSPQFQPSEANSDPRITNFKAGGFYFDQQAWVLFNLKVASKLELSGGLMSLNAALVVELICMAYPRTNPTPSDGVGGRPARFVVTQYVPVGEPGGCMESLEISDPAKVFDCQITSFSSADPNHRAPNIRYTSTVGWRPPVRSGTFARYRYVDIIFGKKTSVKEVKVKLLSDANKVTKMDIYGTNDGRSFFFHEQALVNYLDNLRGSVRLTGKLNSRGLRLVVSEQQKEDEQVTFTIDLWGCGKQEDSRSFDPCSMTHYSLAPKDGFLPAPFTIEPRVFLYANEQLFFCDLILDPFVTFSRRKRCYRASNEQPIKWFDLGPSASQVLTYLPTEGILFAIGSDGQSLVQSSNLGKKWTVINLSAYQIQVNTATSSVNATAIPWSIIPGRFDAATNGAACTAYTGGSWNICYDGIYQNAQLILDWNTKCPAFSPPRI